MTSTKIDISNETKIQKEMDKLNQYEKEFLQKRIKNLKTILPFFKKVQIEKDNNENSFILIVNDFFAFRLNSYCGTWSFWVQKRYNTHYYGKNHAPQRKDYDLPMNIKKWNNKKAKNAIDYLIASKAQLELDEKTKDLERVDAQKTLDLIIKFDGAVCNFPVFFETTQDVNIRFKNFSLDLTCRNKIQLKDVHSILRQTSIC
jgi:hypothetical protein